MWMMNLQAEIYPGLEKYLLEGIWDLSSISDSTGICNDCKQTSAVVITDFLYITRHLYTVKQMCLYSAL